MPKKLCKTLLDQVFSAQASFLSGKLLDTLFLHSFLHITETTIRIGLPRLQLTMSMTRHSSNVWSNMSNGQNEQ